MARCMVQDLAGAGVTAAGVQDLGAASVVSVALVVFDEPQLNT